MSPEADATARSAKGATVGTDAGATRARAWYATGWWLVLPVVAGYLLWRSLRQPEYRSFWGERFLGRGARPAPGKPTVWVHAVSVGETRAAQPLIEALAAQYPQASFVLTHMTPTGRAVGAGVAARLPGRLVQRYLPYDFTLPVRRFLGETRPDIGIILETEIWPALLLAARAAQVPMVLVNARLSERSLARARRWETLIRAAAQAFTKVAAQSDADRARIAQLYAGDVVVLGNLKFDLAPPAELVEQGRALRVQLGKRPVWLFASSRDGEEALVLDAFKSLGAELKSDAILLIVPRHPQRFDEVARLIEARGLRCARRSAGAFAKPPDGRTILLGDSMGEMAMYYAAADLALIGGSILPFGAQNLIEACAVGTPVVLGPSIFNFTQASNDALAAGAAVQVENAAQALLALERLSRDDVARAAMSEAARAFAAAHRGATERTVALIRGVLDAGPA
jgi:3-deoxy-D-manno-octulosonic-acid transferase